MVEPADIGHELLIGNHPTERGTRKESPSVVFVETRRSVAAGIELKIVTTVIVIHDAAEE